jgi:hypothetical protein
MHWDGSTWTEPPTPTPEPEPAAEAGDAPVLELNGRIIRVKMPTPEQLVMWQRIASRLTGTDTTSVDPMRVMKMIDQIVSIFRTVMVDDADGDWMEEQILYGTLDFAKAATFVSDAVQLLSRQAKPAAPTTGPVVRRRR